MRDQNTVKGTGRKAHTTPSGIYLERGYVFLTPDAWKRLYALSKAQGISASQYIASIIYATDNGTDIQGLNNDEYNKPRACHE